MKIIYKTKWESDECHGYSVTIRAHDGRVTIPLKDEDEVVRFSDFLTSIQLVYRAYRKKKRGQDKNSEARKPNITTSPSFDDLFKGRWPRTWIGGELCDYISHNFHWYTSICQSSVYRNKLKIIYDSEEKIMLELMGNALHQENNV